MFRFLLRVVIFLLGLVFVASLLVAIGLLLAVWLLRAGWARLTGRPVTPWVVRVRPRDVWRRFDEAGRDAGRPAARRELGDVTDVEARPVREP